MGPSLGLYGAPHGTRVVFVRGLDRVGSHAEQAAWYPEETSKGWSAHLLKMATQYSQ